MRKMVLGLVMVLVVFFVSLVFLEAGVRIFLPEFDPAAKVRFQWGPEGIPLGEPGTVGRQWKNTGDYDVEVRINRHGLRDGRDLAESAPGDLFVVGDSFAFGWGVEESERFSSLLETTRGGAVYNIAVPAADITTYGKLLEYARARGASVTRLVIALCMENDLHRYPTRVRAEAEGNKPAAAAEPRRRARPPLQVYFSLPFLKRTLAEQSALYGAVTTLVQQNPDLRRLALRAGLVNDVYAWVGKRPFDEESLRESAAALGELASSLETTVLLVPSRGLWVGEGRERERRIHERLLSLLREQGIGAVDMAAIFEEGGDPLQYHFRLDGHWNAAGHRLAAAALAAALEK